VLVSEHEKHVQNNILMDTIYLDNQKTLQKGELVNFIVLKLPP